MKKFFKKESGITLIALVVTIIVLIILAGVSITLVLGDNGIITKAKQGKENYEVAANEEQTMLANVEVSIDSIVGESSTSTVQPEEYAPYDKPYIPTGFKYKEGTWNSGYTIIGETQSVGNEFVWVPCVLDQAKVKPRDTVVTFGKTLPTTTEITDSYYKYNTLNLSLLPTDTSVVAEDSTVAEIETSVGKYGGFYIARYEAGIEGTEENYDSSTSTGKTATNGSVKPLSQAGKGVWNYISRTDAITVSKAMIDNASIGAKSTLISGAAWDTTLQWMISASDNKTTNVGYDIDSTGKGWNNDVSNNTRHLTGYYAVNNIYDMAGNVWDWTTENCRLNGENYIVSRGGSFYNTGEGNPAAVRSNRNGDSSDFVGFRVVLYK